jgi:hypothetical protein
VVSVLKNRGFRFEYTSCYMHNEHAFFTITKSLVFNYTSSKGYGERPDLRSSGGRTD